MKFDESSGVLAQDSTGNGWNGSLSGGTSAYSGVIGSGLKLDGVDGHVSLPAGVVDGIGDFTIAGWVNPNASTMWARWVDFSNDANNYLFIVPIGPAGTPRFVIQANGVEQMVESSEPLPLNQWSHLAVTMSGSSVTIYVDGKQVANSTAFTITPSDLGQTTQNYLGRSHFPWDAYLPAVLDDLNIFDGALGASAIATLAETGKPKALLAFDEGAGTVAGDSTGHAWEASLQNDASWIATGHRGSAVYLDGTDAHVGLANDVTSDLQEFTVAVWVRPDSIALWSRIWDFGTGPDNYMFLTPENGVTNKVRFAIRTPDTGEQVIDGTAALSAGVWSHVAVTLKDGVGTLYVDGVAVGSQTGMTLNPGDLGSTTANYIGKSQFSGDALLTGAVDDLRIYNSALSASEIEELAAP
eukprot:TRINITY_DN3756_c0_g1_i11.p1 TRINITY_DN3756_c0_g1~~TRINITY_DN3756_c0_g1_i11.p1  ORF type:complete len:412 (-),score=122.39 TRINITY_DN3756_c0_g1_i11:44-1279(-)